MARYDAFFKTGTTRIGRWLASVGNRHKLNILFSHCDTPNDAVVIEVGPGKGQFARDLRQRRHSDASYVGVEAHEGGAAALATDGFSMVCGMVPPFPIRSESVDIVHADQVLEHMPDRFSAIAFVEEIHRVLKPGGLLSLSVPDVIDWKSDFYHDYTHNTPMTPHSLRWLVQDCGFEVLECRLYRGPFFGVARIVAWLVLTLFPWACASMLTTGYPDAGRIFKARTTLLQGIYLVARRPQSEKAPPEVS